MEDRVSEKSQAEREIIGCFREIIREIQHNLHLKEGRTQLSMEHYSYSVYQKIPRF